MKILVVGAGGVGGVFGACLAAAGTEVVFVARGAHRDAMARDGLRVLREAGDIHVAAPRLHEDAASTGPCDAVLVTVKLWDLEAAADLIRPLLSPESAVVPLQNGVVAAEVLAAALGPESVLGGVAQVAARIEAPGVIRQTGGFAKLIFGERDGSRSPRAERLLAACEGAGIDASLSSDIEADLWRKFVFLSPMAGACAVSRCTIGAVLHDTQCRAELEALLAETLAVAAAKGIALPPDHGEKVMAFYGKLPPDVKPSMLHDLEDGRRLELDWLNGQVAAFGQALGVETPANSAVTEALKPFAAGASGG